MPGKHSYGKKPRSHMPKGASLSPKGDLGALRSKEALSMKFFKKPGSCMYASDEFKGGPGEIGRIGEKD